MNTALLFQLAIINMILSILLFSSFIYNLFTSKKKHWWFTILILVSAGLFQIIESEVLENEMYGQTLGIQGAAVGICKDNLYNCDDFITQQQAQAMFVRCGGITNDIHYLDGDDDGIACESLP